MLVNVTNMKVVVNSVRSKKFSFTKNTASLIPRSLFDEYFGIPAFYWFTLAIFTAAALLGLWFLVDPAPPRTITLATGVNGGFYERLGRRFKAEMERHGVSVNLRPSKGSVENLATLRNNKSVDVAFIQGGVSGNHTKNEDNPLRSLATLAIEPVWVFARRARVLTDLEGSERLKIAVGAVGSGTRRLSRSLMSTLGILDRSQLIALNGNRAADALLNNEVDAVIYVSARTSSWVQRLINEPSVTFVRAKHAKALARIFPFLSEIHIPPRTLNFQANIPPEEVTMIGVSTNLVVRSNLHSAVKYLLLQTATRLQLGDQLLGTFGRFPSTNFIDFPLDLEAQRYFEHGSTLIRRYLPFWATNLIERFWILSLPILTVLIPLLGFGPPFLQWQIRRRIYVWFRDLNHLVAEAASTTSESQREDLVVKLDTLEKRVSAVDVPLPYVDELYRLRAHIDFVRRQLRLS